MSIFLTGIFIILFILSNKICLKSSLNKVFINIFLIWWFVWLQASTYANKGLLNVSERTYWIFIFYITSFTAAYLIVEKKYQKWQDDKEKRYIQDDRVKIDGLENKKFNIKEYQSGIVIWIFSSAILIVLLMYLNRYNLLLEEYGITYSRIIRFELGYMLRSPIELLFYNYIIQAMVGVIALLIPIHILNRKFKNPIIYIGLAIILINSQIGKGRLIIFELLIYFILTFLIYFHKNIWKYAKMYWKIIVSFIIVGGIGMVFLTLVRLNTDFSDFQSIIKNLEATVNQVVLYFTGSIRAFEYSIQHNFREILLDQYGPMRGMATLGGINEIIVMGLRGLGMEIATANMAMGTLTQPAIFIGENIQYNAFYTALFNYYIDFGIVGIGIFASIFGGISAFLTRKIIQTKDSYYTMILILNLYTILFSLLRWQYQIPTTWIIIGIIIMMRAINKKYILNKSINKKIKKYIDNRIPIKIINLYNWILN